MANRNRALPKQLVEEFQAPALFTILASVRIFETSHLHMYEAAKSTVFRTGTQFEQIRIASNLDISVPTIELKRERITVFAQHVDSTDGVW